MASPGVAYIPEQLANWSTLEAPKCGNYSLKWYALYTGPREERTAAASLKDLWDIETFLPHIRTRNPINPTEPLFPRYIFARFDAQEMFHKVNSSRGVREILKFADRPAEIEESVLEHISRGMDVNGLYQGESLEPGTRVRITAEGPYQDLLGIVEKSRDERVSVLCRGSLCKFRVEVDRYEVRSV